MARRKSKKKSSHKFLKSVILLIIFALIWLVFQYSPVSSRIKNAVREYLPKQKTVQTVHEPKVKPTPHVPEPVVTPPPPTSTKGFSYTIRNPQFDNLSYGVPGKADSIVEREGYALGYVEKHEQPA